MSLRESTVNDAYYIPHGVLVLTPEDKCRLGRKLLAHLHENKQLYCPPDRPVHHIDVRSMSKPMLAEYTMKQIKRGNVDYDDLGILPRARSEISR